jgi:FtsP/CotA-like multicopper oxidase with cupredoxin domain
MAGPTRRVFLGGAVGAGVAGLVGCQGDGTPVGPTDSSVADAEASRGSGPVRSTLLTARAVELDLGGVVVSTWGYEQFAAAVPMRVDLGDQLEVRLRNDLPEPTSVHWHGLALRNDMDGVPGVTQPMVMPGEEFGYRFTVSTPGTHWFHPHHGTQLDRALYAPLLVDDPGEAGDYDVEQVVVLDDWTDGLGPDPDQVFDALRTTGGMHAGMGGMGGMGGGSSDAFGDWDYSAYLVNLRLPGAPAVLRVAPGSRVRLRVLNAAADTAFGVELGGAPFVVTHTDGAPVRPVRARAVRVGMGERYDLLLDMPDEAVNLRAWPLGKSGLAGMVLTPRPGPVGEVPRGPVPAGLVAVGYPDLSPGDAVRLAPRDVDRQLPVTLGGGMHDYVWTINGRTFDDRDPLPVRQGERVRLELANRTMMWHPVHLHGHTFAVVEADGLRKDTVLVPPMGQVQVDLDADNPGQWMLHCHNAYHAEAGMMTTLSYVA